MTSTSTTRSNYQPHQERPNTDVEIHEPFQLSPGLTAALAASIVVIIALLAGSHEAAVAFGAIAAIWLTGVIR